MTLEERLVDLLVQAEEWQQQGRAFTVADLCPDQPELWPQLREMLCGMQQLDGVMHGSDPTYSADGLPDESDAPPAAVPGYELLGQVGRGGMAIVYKARHLQLNRVVALKMLLAGAGAEGSQFKRFLAEGRMVARLRHPNIVQIYEVGEHDGRPFFSLEYVEGGTLADALKGRPRAPREAAALVEQLARAAQYAHEQGVVHRDIKPANVLLARDGTAKLSDFGLARETRVEQHLTQSGLVIGTPSYMAPEQAQGSAQKVGPAVDVHALGVLLYELLTGRPPFRGPTLLDTLVLVMHQEAASLSRVRPGLPRDLATICHHCLEKDPVRRYPSAGALADDLHRFLDGEPIRARRVGELERLAKWARRRPAVAGLLAALLVALVAGTGVSMVFAIRAGIARDKAEWREKDAVIASEAALGARKDAEEHRNAAQRQAAGLYFDRGLALADGGEPDKGLHWMLHALRVAPEGDADFRRAARANLAAWDGQVHALTQVLSHPERLRAVALSPDGKLVLTGCEDGRARLWDTATGECTWESDALGGPVFAVAFSPDGQRFAAGACKEVQWGAATVFLWDRATRRPAGRPIRSPHYVRAIAWSPDGKTLAVGGGAGSDHGVSLWDAASGEPRGAPLPASRECRALAWSPDGQTLAAGDGAESKPEGASVRFWGATGSPAGPTLSHPLGVAALAFSPDGGRLLTGCDDSAVRLWEVGTRKLLRESRYPDRVMAVAFTPDGLQYVTGCDDGMVRFWDAATGREQGAPVRHNDRVRGLAVSADGRLLATASFDRTVRLWELSRRPPGPVDPPDPGAVRAHRDPRAEAGARPPRFQAAAFSPDRTAVALASADAHLARVMAVAPAHPVGRPIRHAPSQIQPIAFGPDGRVATGTRGGGDAQSRIWSASTGEPLSPPLRHHNYVECLAFSPDGKLLADGDYMKQVRLWDVSAGTEAGPPLEQVDIVMCLAFSPDGKTLAAGTADDWSHAPEARLWDVATRQPIGKPMPHATRVTLVAFRPDGRALMTGTWDRVVRLWDAATGEPLGPPAPPLGGELTAAAFSPDGRLLATAGRDGIARLWDGQTGAPIPGGSLPHPAWLTALAFSPDGRTLATGSQDGGARLWDVATRQPLGPRLLSPGPVLAVAFTPDSRALLTAAADGLPRAWPVPEPLAEDDLDRLRLRLEVRTGYELGAGMTTEQLTPEQWQERRRRLTELEGPAGGPPADRADDRGWHDARALDAESRNDSFAALWHLDRLPATAEDWHFHARRARAHVLAGRLDLADTALGRSASPAAKGAPRDWYWQCAVDCEFSQQWTAALWCLDRAIALGPDDALLYQERADVHGRLGHAAEEEADLGRALAKGAELGFVVAMAERHARRGRWQKAADCYLRARQLGGFPLGSAKARALVQLRAGDQAAYRQSCDWLLQMVAAGGRPPATAGLVAWVCALGPDGVADYAPVLGLAEAVLAQAGPQGRPAALLIVGAVLYRAGLYPEALVRLEEARAAGGGSPVPKVWAFLAMAHHRLGHPDEARKCLDKVPAVAPADNPQFWEALEVDVLRREAEALVRGAGPGASR
jgi:WD40 repeat protein/tetratricopeptide (TPR) repeat protein